MNPVHFTANTLSLSLPFFHSLCPSLSNPPPPPVRILSLSLFHCSLSLSSSFTISPTVSQTHHQCSHSLSPSFTAYTLSLKPTAVKSIGHRPSFYRSHRPAPPSALSNRGPSAVQSSTSSFGSLSLSLWRVHDYDEIMVPLPPAVHSPTSDLFSLVSARLLAYEK